MDYLLILQSYAQSLTINFVIRYIYIKRLILDSTNRYIDKQNLNDFLHTFNK